MARAPSVVCLGEAMGEIGFARDGSPRIGVGGDTFNTAIYLARAGVETAFCSRVGTDPFGSRVRAALIENGVSDALLAETDDATTGLYSISLDAAGERSFHYWRDSSAARGTISALTDADRTAIRAADFLYLSGISLYAFEDDAEALIDLLGEARAGGSRILFDGNYRPRLWAGRTERARDLFARVLALTDTAFPTYDDEVMLWGDAGRGACLDRLRGAGVATVVLKEGPEGCVIRDASGDTVVPVPERIRPVDTTAAGDSFNAAYIAATIAGKSPADAALAGHRLAGRVIQVPGALLPKDL